MRLLILTLALVSLGGCSMADTPTPDYRVERTAADGQIEIRRYDTLVVADVSISGDRGSAANRGFRPLADYIFGGNQRGEKIGMTAPVLQTAEGDVSADRPVDKTERWQVQFIMPEGAALDSLPRPKDRSVTLHEWRPDRVAVLRFSGFNWADKLEEKRQALRAWLDQEGLDPQGPAVFAFYDPPWTPPFLKRNEVMIALRDNDPAP